ncbi:MAG TPA: ABC transporter ATP-binding protein [Candidatus Dojkabacteria bacterium]|nr:ABC transporter ATP-binding protein [Candidatus Dojkabacteria bacterium]
MNPSLVDEIQKEVLTKYNGDVDQFFNDIKQLFLTSQSEITQNNTLSKTKLGKPKDEIIVEVKNLSKEYKIGSEVTNALQNVNLSIKKGEMVAIMGPSGSGKSTFLNILAGLEKPTSGSTNVAGYDVARLTDNQASQFRNRVLGFIFQFFYLQPFLRIRENVEIPLFFADIPKSKRYIKSRKLLKDVGLEAKEKHLPKHLSGGQMQRIAIIRALINEPQIILADEPTGNLDRKTGNEVMNLLADINRESGTTIIIVTHDEKIAEQAHRIIQFEDGKIVTK